MQLPPSYTFQKRLHGAGEGVCILGKDPENNDVVIKIPSEAAADFGVVDSSQKSVEAFQAAKRREQSAAAALPDIFQAGRLETEGEQVFWVRPYWPRTLRDWVAFKESPSAGQLRSICLAIVRGLAALARLDGGGHGNLSLSNILMGGPKHMELRLVDVLEASAAGPQADKRALGLVLYQLVRSEFVEVDRSVKHVSTEEDWTKVLGKSGQQWKALCNDLLDPHSRLAQADWAEVEERIQGLGDNESSRGKWIIICVVLLGGLGSGLFIFWQSKEDAVTVDTAKLEAQWTYVLDQYFGWARSFLASRRDFERSEHPGAKAFVREFEPKGSFGSDDMAELLDRVVPEARALFRSAPTEAEQLAREVAVLELGSDDQAGIVRAERYMKELRKNLEEWQVVAELRESRHRFEADGFAYGVERMDRQLESFVFEGSELRYETLFELKKSAEGVGDLQRAYRRFHSEFEQLESIPGLRFGRFYANAAKEQLAGLQTEAASYLRVEAAQAQRLREAWQGESGHLAVELFQQAEESFLERVDVRQADVVDQWIALLQSYRIIDRVELERDLDALKKELNALIAELDTTERQLAVEEPTVSALSGRYEQVLADYQENRPQTWIEAERADALAAAGQAESSLKRLRKNIQSRLAELKIDIPTALAEMRRDTLRTEVAVLESAWRSFKSRYLEGKTVESFTNDREFIDFRRAYSDQRARLERFESNVLLELRKSQTPALSSVSQARREAGLEIWAPIYREREDAFLKLAAGLLFEAGEPWGRIDLELQKTQAVLGEIAGKLNNYLKDVEDALTRYEAWILPEGGLAEWFAQLDRTPQRASWSGESLMRKLLAPLRQALTLETADTERLWALLEEQVDGTDAFLQFLAMRRIAEAGFISVSGLDQLQNAVQNLDSWIPESRSGDWSALQKDLWQAAYKAAESAAERAACFRAISTFRVVTADLSGRQRLAFELWSSIELLEKEAAAYESRPVMLEEVKNTFQTLPIEENEALAALLKKMSEVDLNAEGPSLEEAAFVGKGWQIAEDEEERKVLEWSGHRQVFYRVDGEEEDFFIAETEMSIRLFMDWMAVGVRWPEMSRKVPGEWREFIENAYNPGPSGDLRRGPRLWNPGRGGLVRSGVRRPLTWFGGFDSYYEEMFSSNGGAVLAPVADLSFELPMQHTGAELARAAAESMGMRLPQPSDWEALIRQMEAAAITTRVWNQEWSEGLDAGLLSEIRLDSFYTSNDIPASGGGNAEPPIFLPVDQSPNKIKHLAGNVAEYLYDEKTEEYHVAGGSALSEMAGTWGQIFPIPANRKNFSFSDVGLRLCFDAPLPSPHAQFLDILKKAWQDI